MDFFPNGLSTFMVAAFIALAFWQITSMFSAVAMGLVSAPASDAKARQRALFFQVVFGSLWVLIFGGAALWNGFAPQGKVFWLYAFSGAATVPLLVVPMTFLTLRSVKTKKGGPRAA